MDDATSLHTKNNLYGETLSSTITTIRSVPGLEEMFHEFADLTRQGQCPYKGTTKGRLNANKLSIAKKI